MPESRDECRPVTLPPGETIHVRGRSELCPDGIAALAAVVDAARDLHAAEHPYDPGAIALYERCEAARNKRVLFWAEAAAQAGVRLRTMIRLRQGIAPDDRDRARIEAWLAGVDSQDA